MLHGLNLEDILEYQSDLDTAKGTPEASVFKLNAVDSRVMAKLRDQTTVYSNGGALGLLTHMNTSQVKFQTVQFGLKNGWDNFRDKQGRPIPFETDNQIVGGQLYVVASAKSVAYLHPELITELSDQINALNVLTPAEVKNSET